MVPYVISIIIQSLKFKHRLKHAWVKVTDGLVNFRCRKACLSKTSKIKFKTENILFQIGLSFYLVYHMPLGSGGWNTETVLQGKTAEPSNSYCQPKQLYLSSGKITYVWIEIYKTELIAADFDS